MPHPPSRHPSRSVTFIGGTAYSGSTLLDMILANDRTGFSCGEVGALVYPFRHRHRSPPCGCGQPDCDIWHDPRAATTDVHRYLFNRFPELSHLVDSSKSVEWIWEQQRRLAGYGIASHNVLIWKSPQEYYQSRKKRSKERGWLQSWLGYHRRYMAVIDRFVSIRYSDLVSSPESLSALCRHLGIANWDGKISYWNKRHHTLFGNASAKIHLYPRNSSTHLQMHDELDQLAVKPDSGGSDTFRRVYQETWSDSGLKLTSRQWRAVREVVAMIAGRDVTTVPVRGAGDEVDADDFGRMSLTARLALTELYLKRSARHRLFDLAGIER